MLPGFRILFATVVLAVSVLIFGLGAAALLRASHEEFASVPSWRPTQPPQFASKTEPVPTLAMLRVETPTAKAFAQEPVAAPEKWPATQPVVAVTTEKIVRDVELPVAALTVQASAPQASGPDEALAVLGTPDIKVPEPTYAPLAIVPLPRVRPDLAPTKVTLLQTEASEPQASQAVTPQVRSTEATAAETVAKPAKRVRRASAQRRLAIARARAARAAQRQQQNSNPAFSSFGG